MNENRRAKRDSLFMLAALRLADEVDALRVKVRNLSCSGMMAECAVHAEAGERVMIDLRNIGWVTGSVAWTSNNRLGIRFDHEIDARAVRQPLPAPPEIPEMCVRRPLAINTEPPPPPNPTNLRRV